MDFYTQQAFQMRNEPGLSIADGQFIDQWEERARLDDRHYVQKQVRKRRQAGREKAAEVLDRISELQDAFVAVRKRAERNEVPWAELAKVQRQVASDRMALEKVLESLQATEAANQNMESDPTAWLTAFYARFPALSDRRPNLAAALAEDQRKRGRDRIH